MVDTQGWQFGTCYTTQEARIENALKSTQENFRFLCNCYIYNYWEDRTDAGLIKLKTTVLFVELACSTNYVSCLTGNPNFRLRLHHLKFFGSGPSHPKLLGLRLHSPEWHEPCLPYPRYATQWRAEVLRCLGQLLGWIPTYKILILSSSVWWPFLLVRRCLWRHNMTLYSRLQINVLANFVDTTSIFRDAGAAVGQGEQR